MIWYLAPLTAEQVAAGEELRRKASFEEAFVAARGPRMMALFRKERADGGVDLFFTPECQEYAAELLSGWGVLPCQPPALIGLELLVGHNEITYYLT